MELVDGYVHDTGQHCGATALRNVTRFYGTTYSEGACFGIGGGAAFVLYEHPDEPWVTFRTSPTWLEQAYFERLGVSHLHRAGDDFETAWAEVTARVDEDDPVILFLDPTELDYLGEGPVHIPPHVAVLVGYDEDIAQLADGSMAARQDVSKETLQKAWQSDRFVPLDNEYLVVNRSRFPQDRTDAAAAGLRQAATYMLDPLHVKRDARGPGEEGLPALRSFADYLGTWPDYPESARPVRDALRSIDEHGEGAAHRSLFADALGSLGRQTGLPHDFVGETNDVARQWQSVATQLEATIEDPTPARFEEAASLVGAVADREEALFERLADELGLDTGRD